MKKNKRLLINMIAQIISFIINMAISFFLTPFIVKNIGREAYGFVGLSNDFISYSQILVVALNSMAGRFITISISKGEKETSNKYFTTLIIANIVLASILIVPIVFIILNVGVLFNISNNMVSDVQILFGFIFLNLIISILGSVFSIATFAKNRLELAAIRNIQANFIKVSILLILFIALKPNVWYIGVATLFSSIFTIYSNIKYTKLLIPEIEIRKKYFSYKALKELLSSGIWNSFSQLSVILSSGLNLLITNIFVGASSMGILSISRTIPNMILSVFAMLSNTFAPQLTISYAQDDVKEMKRQLFLSIKLLGVISSIPIGVLFVYGDSFYKLWVPDQNFTLLYYISIIITLELMVALPLESLWNIFTVTNKVKYSALSLFGFSIMTLITIFMGISVTEDLYLRMFIIAGTSSLYGIIRSLTFLPIYGAKCLKLKWFTFYPMIFLNIISIIIVTIISICLKLFLNINSWIDLIVVGSITTVISIMINSFIVLNKKERKKIIKLICKRI